ncbi:YbfB/YjiJ family MFS transporter [Lampropedia aestuarii]|uniref:YbfB/YjiJ family MFS transporter n=1 Tax=Lampropedia aestuarii TaxID=2562762 RepID=UPI0024693286|nr:YbfB/YjiJ family MFS transporter [Lampropedia aestuarii]MDH5856405.1 YbfB/YjiJ family MFS transporter [Lampropedia aestuarii]
MASPTTDTAPQPLPPSPSALTIALAGAISLACALGLGRFAFTPLLPLMVQDGLVDLRFGSWLATLNYIGYLLGALSCMALPFVLHKHSTQQLRQLTLPLLRGGLIGTTLLLFVMALPLPSLWALARTVAGIVSAWVFVYTTAWCLEQLAVRQANQLGGLIYAGPGIGIAVSGLLVSKMALWQAHAQLIWAVIGTAAIALSAFVWHITARVHQHEQRQAPASAPQAAPVASGALKRRTIHWSSEQVLLAIAYGFAGFGYIITATYLPVIARTVMPGSPWIALFWPIFGLAVAVGAASTRFIAPWRDRRTLLILSYLLQALGVVLPLWLPNSIGFILGSILLGLPFTALTLFAVQEVRRLLPEHAAPFIGAITTLYGIGQIAGPPMVVWILGRASSQQQGFALALSVAAATLVIGAALFLFLRLRYPIRTT